MGSTIDEKLINWFLNNLPPKSLAQPSIQHKQGYGHKLD